MAVTLSTLGADPTNLIQELKRILDDLQSQLNANSSLYTSDTGKVDANSVSGDIAVTLTGGKITIYYIESPSSKVALTADMLGGMLSKGTNFLGLVTGTTIPTVTQFPNSGDWGFYQRTSTTPNQYYLSFNFAAAVKSVQLT